MIGVTPEILPGGRDIGGDAGMAIRTAAHGPTGPFDEVGAPPGREWIPGI